MKLLKSRRRLLKQKRKAVVAPPISEDQLELCSKFFNLEHYRKATGASSFTHKEGLQHYLTKGWRDGLDPSNEFSTRGYLELYPDVTEAGMNPLLHYVLHGRFENRHIQRADGGFFGKLEALTLKGIRGWGANEHNPAMIMPLKVSINGQLYTTIYNDRPRPDLRRQGIAEGAGGFQLAIPFGRLEPGKYQIAIEFPDGNRLEDELSVESVALPSNASVPMSLTAERASKLKVVVPIYNAIEDVRVCINRLREHTPDGVEVILVNDGSSDPAITDELAKLESESRFRILHNENNMGFTKTVNRGICEAGDADVIILNSDARVTPRWVEGMEAAAHSRPRVATVTAMSDRAGAFSAPSIGNDNPLPAGVSEEDFATAFRRRSLRLYPEVPTGNGFCMLIRREALDALGALDADAFPRGYGEENDFCMRALRAGWANLIDDATYVFHDRSKSFGEEKIENIAKGRAVVDRRYPEYKLLTGIFQTGSSIVMARYRARMALADCTNGRGILPRALFVLATRTGGTPQTNADLMGALSDAFECYVLVCDSRALELSVYEDGNSRVLKTYQLNEAIEPLTHVSSEYDKVVSTWMGALDLSIVHIRHLGWHSLNLPALARQTGARVIMSFHDYYALSPSLKLLDDENVFCGDTFTEAGSHRPIEIWPGRSLPTLTEDWIGYWRERMAKALSNCDSFVTTSQSARDRIAEAFPNIPSDHFHVIPHGRDFAEFKNLHRLPDGASPARILVPGNINGAKGLDLIAALIDLDRLGLFEFHILGAVKMDDLTEQHLSRLHFHGRYDRADFAKKVEAIAPHFGVVFSIWDETYCHTLTEMWSVGLPVAVLDFPNLRNRVTKSGAGWILEDLRTEAVYESLAAIVSDHDDQLAKGIAAQRWQRERGRAQSCDQMASRYLDVYAGRSVHQPKPKIAILPQHDSTHRNDDRIRADRIWERARNGTLRPNTYIRSTPFALIAQMRLGMIDAAIIQRDTIPASLVDLFLRVATQTQTPFILDIDENLLEVPTDADPRGYFKAYASHLEKLIAGSSAVTVPSRALSDRIRNINGSVIVLSDGIEARLWADGRESLHKPEIRVLYLATSSSLAENQLALDILEATRQKMPGLFASVIGADPEFDWPSWIDVVSSPPECRTYDAFVPWLKSNMQTAAMGIAPSVDTPFDECLSDRRILEYGALGLPVLASDTSHYRKAAKAFSVGVELISNSPEDWSKSLTTAFVRPDRLIDKGQALQSWIFANRSLKADLPDFDTIVQASLQPGSSEQKP